MKRSFLFVIGSIGTLAIFGSLMFAMREYFFMPKHTISERNVGMKEEGITVSVSDMDRHVPENMSPVLTHTEEPSLAADISKSKEQTIEQSQEKNVPFVVQAPTGEWDNPIFQSGCEEASILMAAHFGDTGPISPEAARREIVLIANLSKKLFETSVDTSAQDTLQLFQSYTKRTDGALLDPATEENMREALADGNILMVPMDGQSLDNPHFTDPGPETHMLIIIGYDTLSQEYITNDPGTRFGAGYRYGVTRFLDAMRDYPTGDHLPIKSRVKRAIVIGKDAARP